MPDKIFVKVTNQDIYKTLQDLIESNTDQHNQILLHQKETNGKVKLNRWISSTALGCIFIIIGYAIQSVF